MFVGRKQNLPLHRGDIRCSNPINDIIISVLTVCTQSLNEWKYRLPIV